MSRGTGCLATNMNNTFIYRKVSLTDMQAIDKSDSTVSLVTSLIEKVKPAMSLIQAYQFGKNNESDVRVHASGLQVISSVRLSAHFLLTYTGNEVFSPCNSRDHTSDESTDQLTMA